MNRPTEKLNQVPWYRIAFYYAVFFAASLTFVWLAGEIIEQETLPVDTAVLEWIHRSATPTLDRIVIFVTNLGGPIVAPIAAVVLFGFFLAIKERWNSIYVVLTLGGTFLLNTVLKLLFHRTRPSLWDLLVEEHSYSFPSGHAMISMSLALTVIVLAFHSRGRWAAIVLGTLYVLAIGFTRMYLGVHYPSDILGGWLMSTVWVLVVTAFMMRNTSFRTDTLS